MDLEIQTEQIYTLVFVKSTPPDKVLLGMKKRGFGAGKWNGYGGKVERGESIADCAARELFEESNLLVNIGDLVHLGCIVYETIGKCTKRVVHIFETGRVEGVLTETEEMRPRWFDVSDIPYGKMWPDSSYWLPYILSGLSVIGHFLYDANEAVVGNSVRINK